MAELIKRDDSLNTGREKLNNAIEKVDTFQDQINTIVVDGDSSVEAAQARIDADNNAYPTLKARLDAKETQTSEQLAQKPNQDEVRKETSTNPIRMSELHTEVKLGMTGGSVPVVDIDAVGNENLKTNSSNERTISLFNSEIIEINNYEPFLIMGAIDNPNDLPRLSYDDTTSWESIIVKIEPNTSYILEKEISDKFRIALHHDFPEVFETLSRYVKDDSIPAESITNGIESFSIKTKSNENFLIVQVSSVGETPKLIIKTHEPAIATLNKPIQSPNFILGKNRFKGEYIKGSFGTTLAGNEGVIQENELGEIGFVKVESNNTFTISKTSSSRFRVALSDFYPRIGGKIYVTHANENDNETEVTVTTGEKTQYLLIYVTNEGQKPSFIQVEKGNKKTEWKTYGYKPYPEEKDYSSIGIIKDRDRDGKVYVRDFEGDEKSDAYAIQDAFDYADSQIVVFDPYKNYVVDRSLIANVAKVRGIDGQNALTQIRDVDSPIIIYKGSKIGAGASPVGEENRSLAMTEMNPFIKHLRLASHQETYIGTGIEFEGTFGLLIQACHAFNLKDGFKAKGMNRNFNLTNNNIWNLAGYGVFWDGGSAHQQNVTGNHISYCRRALFFNDSDMHNVQIVGNDIESGNAPSHSDPESLIDFYASDSPNRYFEAIHIVGNSLQDHGRNIAPLLNFASDKEAGIQDLMIGNNQLGNSVQDSFYAKGLDRATFTGNSIKGNGSPQSINLDGINKNVAISGNQLRKGVKWSSETTKTAITGNVASDFALPDSNDGKVLVANNV